MILLIAAIFLFAYMVVVIVLLLIASSLKKKESNESRQYSVVIAARNEEKNIAQCLRAIMSQTIQPNAIVVADDHSTDRTAIIVRSFADKDNLVKYVSCSRNETGKRLAIEAALKQVESEIVLSTDADCIVGECWAEEMMQNISEDQRLITGPVVLNRKAGIFNQIQFAELLFLVAGGAVLAKAVKAIQVSGANMCFFRTDFLSFVQSGHGAKYGSGDDVFFMEFIHSHYGWHSVQFCNNAKAVVSTGPELGLKKWFTQRLRWASKSKGYKSIMPFFAGFVLLLTNIAFWIAFASLFCGYFESRIAWLSLSAKMAVEILLMVVFLAKWKQKFPWAGIALLPVLYLWFLSGVAVFSLFSNSKTWKSRTIG